MLVEWSSGQCSRSPKPDGFLSIPCTSGCLKIYVVPLRAWTSAKIIHKRENDVHLRVEMDVGVAKNTEPDMYDARSFTKKFTAPINF